MNKLIKLGALALAGSLLQVGNGQPAGAGSNVPATAAFHVVDRGPNHRVWQNETYEKTSAGKIVTQVHNYQELATGLNYLSNGQWVESQEVIEPVSGGAVARQGQHQVNFANNLNSLGAIDHQTPDGRHLRSNLLGLSYYDTANGQSVLIGQIKDSQGQIIGGNQVLYPDAFDGVKADVRYTYKRGSFEQDVILREQLPRPRKKLSVNWLSI